jgi:hypothetical protein
MLKCFIGKGLYTISMVYYLTSMIEKTGEVWRKKFFRGQNGFGFTQRINRMNMPSLYLILMGQ